MRGEDMTPEQAKIIERLLEKTMQRRARWSASQSASDQFTLRLDKNSIILTRMQNFQTNQIELTMTIWNMDGQKTDEIRQTNLDSDKAGFRALLELFDLIKTSKGNVEDTLKDVLEELESDGVVG
jgi:hypothetical protein